MTKKTTKKPSLARKKSRKISRAKTKTRVIKQKKTAPDLKRPKFKARNLSSKKTTPLVQPDRLVDLKKLYQSQSLSAEDLKLILLNQEYDALAPENDLLPGQGLNINIAQDPLDIYQSPHLLDLSQVKFIERVRPAPTGEEINFQDLPGGEFLQKTNLLNLLDWERSELLSLLGQGIKKTSRGLKRPFYPVDTSIKLPLLRNRRGDGKIPLWQEISFVNLIFFLGSLLNKIISPLRWLVGYLGVYFKDFLTKDEIIDFADQKITLIDSRLPVDDLLTNLETAAEESEPELVLVKPEKNLIFKSKNKLTWPQIAWPNFSLGQFDFQFKNLPWRSVAYLVLVALMIILPVKFLLYWQEINSVKGEVMGEAESALANLDLAKGELAQFNLAGAKDYFVSANQNFVSAQKQLAGIESFLTILAEAMPAKNALKTGKNIIELGEHLTKAGEYLLASLEKISEQNSASLTEKIKFFAQQLNQAKSEMSLAEANLKQTEIKHLPLDKRESFNALTKQLPLFIQSADQSKTIIDFALKFLADGDFRRYLVIFQNDNELRASGGFMGSFALVDIKSGEISKIELPAGGTYDVRAGLNETLAAPGPLQLINPRWEFQDANWWPDWSTSAQKIAWFYQKSGGPTVDGVIAINSDWLGKLLAVVGDIDLPDYQKTITPANFEQEIQESVELEYADRQKPKKILADLAPELLKRVFAVEADKFLPLISILADGLKEKDILVYAFDSDEEKFIADNNWGGQLKNSPKDYLSVVATNIGGGKTDNIVKQQIYHQAKIMADGSVVDQLLIRRYHFGPTDEFFTANANRSYLRVYLPLGSQLIKAAGFNQPLAKEYKIASQPLIEDANLTRENAAFIDTNSQTKVYEENGKTVFANWLTLKPGETQDLLLIYKLPFKLSFGSNQAGAGGLWQQIAGVLGSNKGYDSYSLLAQKQPGSNDDEFSSELIYPADYELKIKYPQESKSGDQQIIFQDKLKADLFYLAGFKY